MAIRRVFITGASSGLGASLAQEFLTRGATVWGIGRRVLPEGRFEEASREGRFRYSACDVNNEDHVRRVLLDMSECGFQPDVVILNAGIALDDIDRGRFDCALFRQTVTTNLFGSMEWVEAFLPLFLERERGTFAAISSLAAYRAITRKKIGYPSSKAALTMAFESLRLQCNSRKVRFLCFCPGPMAERGSLITISYEAAARKIASRLDGRMPFSTRQFPVLASMLFMLGRLLPDVLISRLVRQKKKASL